MVAGHMCRNTSSLCSICLCVLRLLVRITHKGELFQQSGHAHLPPFFPSTTHVRPHGVWMLQSENFSLVVVVVRQAAVPEDGVAG